jgi:hypothetical protein
MQTALMLAAKMYVNKKIYIKLIYYRIISLI